MGSAEQPADAGDGVDGSGPSAVCARCGARADGSGLPLTWTTQVTARGRQWLCLECTRHNLRSIEGKLDEPWW